ncbi:uncharacterized protein A1O9_11117 [Exophiala aquamarina CBS 119918]|uniref:Zn(2)-C6 fungal-type domain-containing protein n=1 Tax=Exophiala aquamarina CBS 119918 TaxID=1182545 RepID=A0A072PAV3_9EURO|nr:uncharacterized protein A1O9_11117 [Exophiala aquamarina CBS 119918]KEF52700.1 hypothetical protein A1O9_11117 [Exophiala aquamarina CBS 119918]
MLQNNDRYLQRSITRRRTGCLVCRLRRKKCDEEKPVCRGCARNVLVCRWPPLQNGEFCNDARSWRQTRPTPTEQLHSDLQSSHLDRESSTLSFHTSNSTKWSPAYPLGQLLAGLSSKPMLLRTEVGSHFFQHFLELVALQLSSRNDPENPWISLFIPLAMGDELVMSTLLALGGANLCTYSGHALKQTYSFYAVALRSVKHRVTELVQGNYSHLLNTLVTTIALSQFEAMIGDTRGVLLCHLQACRELLLLIQRKSISIDPAVLAFTLELYLYASAVGTSFVYDDRPAKLTFDSEYDSLQSLCCDSRGYGFMLGYAGRLFQLLPRLGQTVGRWISQDCDLESSSADKLFLFFQAELQGWAPSYHQDTKMPTLSDTVADNSEPQSTLRRWHHEAQVVARIYHQAMLAFLYMGRHGRRPPDEALFALIDPLIAEFLRLRASLPPESPIWSIMLWPTVMIGSCIRRPDYQMLITEKDCCMLTVLNAFDVLQQIWDDEREIVFGAVGLSIVCTSQKITLCPI